MRRNQEVKDKQPDRKKASQESAVSLKHSEELFPEGRSDQLCQMGQMLLTRQTKGRLGVGCWMREHTNAC